MLSVSLRAMATETAYNTDVRECNKHQLHTEATESYYPGICRLTIIISVPEAEGRLNV